MGISTRYYTIYGVELPYDPLSSAGDNEEFHEILYEKSAGFDHIADAMSANYLLLGKVLFRSGDLRWSETIDTWNVIQLDKLEEIDKEWRSNFVTQFPEYAYLIENLPSRLITFAHYS